MDRHSSDKEQGENAPPSPVQSDSDPFMHDEDEELLDYECSDFYEDMDSPIQPMHAASDALSQPAAATALHQPLHHDSAKPACKSAAQRIIFNLSPSSAASTKSHATSPLDTAGELSDRDRKDRVRRDTDRGRSRSRSPKHSAEGGRQLRPRPSGRVERERPSAQHGNIVALTMPATDQHRQMHRGVRGSRGYYTGRVLVAQHNPLHFN